ncbi:MAG: DUF805 domain-containing protein, partial [Asticcacaulis sp.]
VSVTLLLRPKDLMSPKGRIGRVTYVLDLILFNVLFFGVDFGAAYSAQTLDPDILDRFGWLYAVVAVLALLLIYILFCIHAKRLHDIGLTGFICLVMFLPPLLTLFLSLDGTSFDLPVTLVRVLDIASKAAYGLSFLLQIALLFLPGRHDRERLRQ